MMDMEDAGSAGNDAQRYVWGGDIPLQIHLHDEEVTTLSPPPPALILASRLGYLPLLAQQIKPFFSSALPPGVDTVWFDYRGLPLKWYIPTWVLFDLLCAEPERPLNLTVHFRGYPGNILTPCVGEDSVKWSFINALKEASYVINGNCKNVMNMSQSDQKELWLSVLNEKSLIEANIYEEEDGELITEEASSSRVTEDPEQVSNENSGSLPNSAEIKLIRIQGIEPKLDIPFSWVVNNLMNPEHYLHICVYVKVVEPITI